MMTVPDKHLGLTGLRTDELKNLLRLVYSNKLVCPFDKKTLMTMGFNRVSEFGECLQLGPSGSTNNPRSRNC